MKYDCERKEVLKKIGVQKNKCKIMNFAQTSTKDNGLPKKNGCLVGFFCSAMIVEAYMTQAVT